jgi:hypothetical protein
LVVIITRVPLGAETQKLQLWEERQMLLLVAAEATNALELV